MAIKKLLILALILVALWPISSYADEPRISLEEIEKLIDSSPSRTLKAYFKTVPRGIKIKSYKITIEGIFREPDLEVILFKSRHQIASGMSGSPVYIKGKKIGPTATWYENGKKRYIGFYTDDVPTGKWIYWDENGNIAAERNESDIPSREPSGNTGK